MMLLKKLVFPLSKKNSPGDPDSGEKKKKAVANLVTLKPHYSPEQKTIPSPA